MTLMKHLCARCGSDDVRSVFTVYVHKVWNVSAQEWVQDGDSDSDEECIFCYCDACGSDDELDEVEVGAPGTPYTEEDAKAWINQPEAANSVSPFFAEPAKSKLG